MRTTVLRWAVLLALFFAAACGPGPTPGVDASTADASSTAGTFVVRVVDPTFSPIAGATVALDAPSRLEMLTDADGMATFPIDWALGTADVIAWADGYGVRAWVDLDRADYEGFRADGALVLRVRDTFRAGLPTAEVTGSFSNFASSTNYVLTFHDLGFEQWSSLAPDPYALTVPTGFPFHLTAIEVAWSGDALSYDQPIVAWVAPPEHVAITADTVVDIDLAANRITPTEISGSFPLPADPWFDAAYPYIVVADADGVVPFGIPTHANPRADGSAIDYSTAYVLPSPTTPHTTTFTMQGLDDGALTFATYEGARSGDQTFTLLRPPAVDPPAGGGFHHVFDEFSTAIVPSAYMTFIISGGGQIQAEVSGPIGASRVRLPPLPSGAGAGGLFLVADMVGNARLCVPDPGDIRRVCPLEAVGAAVPVDP